MKKVFSLLLVFLMVLSSVSVLAEELNDNDNPMLMEDVKAELERRLIEEWANLGTGVDISDLNIHRDDIAAIYALIIYENPLFYYVEKRINGTANPSTGMMLTLIPVYTETNLTLIKQKWAEIDKATEEMLLYINPDMTDFEKIMAVHDYMVLNYVYDYQDPDQSMMIILDRSGVCTAYAEVFVHMMNVLGIEATVVRSNDMGHIWNLVKLDGQWYHIDVTWDDLAPDQFAMVNHKYALLSTKAMLEMGYYNFDAAGHTADSTLYDNAAWHNAEGAIVNIDGVTYHVSGNNLIDENANIIYSDLDCGDGWWNLSKNSGFRGDVLAGLCELNGILYFNTDTAIYSYDPKTKKVECLLEEYGICGIFADENVLMYTTYDSSVAGFIKAGEIRIADIKLAEPYYEDGEAVVRLYNDSNEAIWVISKGDTYKIAEITEKGVNTVKFDNGNEQTIFIWKSNMEPFFEKNVVSE